MTSAEEYLEALKARETSSLQAILDEIRDSAYDDGRESQFSVIDLLMGDLGAANAKNLELVNQNEALVTANQDLASIKESLTLDLDRQLEKVDYLNNEVYLRDQRIRSLLDEIERLKNPVRFLYGGASYNNGSPSTLESMAGKKYGIRRTFWNYTQTGGAMAAVKDDILNGRVPLLSFKVGGWANANTGAMDAWAKSLADQLSAVSGRVMVAIHHEPEGDGDIAQWTKMQQRLAPFFNRPNIDFGVILTGWHQFYGQAQYKLDALWPTGAPIKFLGLDIYQWYGTTKDDGSKVTKWDNFETEYFMKIKSFCDTKGIYWGLAETGLTDVAWSETSQGKTWFNDIPELMRRYDGRFFSYFNTTQNPVNGSTWALTGDKQTAFLEALKRYGG